MPPPSYIFVLCPPFCGSTILWQLVCTSPHVSALPTEGQFLPAVRTSMRQQPWDGRRQLPWTEIKEAWHSAWDLNQPYLVEKSPPNLLRAREISEHFEPAYFLVMVRDPYAHCESLIRRNGLEARQAATFSMNLMTVQAGHAASLPRCLAFTYEQMIDSTAAVCAKVQDFLPGLGALNPKAGQLVAGALANSNASKIASLSAADLTAIGEVLAAYPETLDFWGYAIR